MRTARMRMYHCRVFVTSLHTIINQRHNFLHGSYSPRDKDKAKVKVFLSQRLARYLRLMNNFDGTEAG